MPVSTRFEYANGIPKEITREAGHVRKDPAFDLIIQARSNLKENFLFEGNTALLDNIFSPCGKQIISCSIDKLPSARKSRSDATTTAVWWFFPYFRTPLAPLKGKVSSVISGLSVMYPTGSSL